MKMESILFSEMTPAPEWEAEFNDWYDTEHIPLRMAVPGFKGAQRYRGVGDTPGYLAVYDMNRPEVLKSPEYAVVKGQPSDLTKRMLRDVSGFTRYIGSLSSWQLNDGVSDEDMLMSPVLYSVMFAVPEERRSEFDDWYVEDHVPALFETSDWLGCRRYNIVDGEPGAYTHLALHHLKTAAALDSDARAEARKSDWRARLAEEPWFSGIYRVFARHGERFTPSV